MKTVAITGPESTGKSQLAAELAAHYQTIWVPEYAREYLTLLGRSYVYSDVLKIARKQFSMMKEVPPGAKETMIIDTELIVTKIWCDVKYGKCHPWIIKNIDKQQVDLYLLTNIDLPWQHDPLREHPHLREHLFALFKSELETRGYRFAVINGIGEERLINAIQAVEKIR